MKKYKVLNSDFSSPFKGFGFKLGKQYACDDFDTDKSVPCSRGFYATGLNGLVYSYSTSKIIVECEVSGKRVEFDQFKQRYEKIELVRVLPKEEVVHRMKTARIEEKEGYKAIEALFPIHPFEIKPVEITDEHIELLKNWNSVRNSVRNSVWHSVGDSVWSSVRHSVGDSVWDSVWNSVRDIVWNSVWSSVGDSVWDSVWNSVWNSVRNSVGNIVKDSVRDSVWDSVWNSVDAYISSLFPGITNWKYIDHVPGKNPFQPAIDLWKMGIVPSFDGKTYRLHSGPKATVVYETII